jgi:RNA polymerase sigma factor (TIGR02999 family)
MDTPVEGSVTRLLREAAGGDAGANGRLLALVYDDLRRLARAQLAGRRPDESVAPTALVHEAFVRLIGTAETPFENRRHFFVVAAKAMHRILVEHARKRLAERRGGGKRPLDVT